jgi:hypothetical protein
MSEDEKCRHQKVGDLDGLLGKDEARALARSGYAYFPRFVNVLVPKRSTRLVFIEAYFDETNTHSGSSMYSMAGYVFEKDKAIALQEEWQPILDRFGLQSFHMVDCAHGNRAFKKVSKENRILISTSFIDLVGKYAELGIASKFITTFGANEFIKDYFSFFCGLCMAAVRGYTEKRSDIDGVVYFFERGNDNQTNADAYVRSAMASHGVSEAHKYINHAFIPKEHCAAIQAADMLAWLHGKTVKDFGIRPTRKDYIALTEKVSTQIVFANKRTLRDIRAYFRRLSSPISASFSVPMPLDNYTHVSFNRINSSD